MEEKSESKEFSVFNIFDFMLSGALNIVSKLSVDMGISLTKELFNFAGNIIDSISVGSQNQQK